MGIYQVSDVSFNTDRYVLVKDNKEAYIGPLASKLLYYFIENSGKVLTRDDLAYSVWGYAARDHTITQAIATLRSNFSELNPLVMDVIKTVPKKGYLLELEGSETHGVQENVNHFNPSKMKFLVVDDHPFVRKMHTELLHELGAGSVDNSESAEDALRKISDTSFDCIFADLELVDMNGLELIKRIRLRTTAKTPSDVYTFVITAHANPKILGTALLLDVNAFLPKPADLTDIRKKFRILSTTVFEYKPPIAYEMVDTKIESYFKSYGAT